MDRVPLNRSMVNAAVSGVAARFRGVGSGDNAQWSTYDGSTIVDLTPETYLARLTGERLGATYGWERVYVDSDVNGTPVIRTWIDAEAQRGDTQHIPAIEPNGNTNLPAGLVVKIWPCEQGGTWKYYIIGMDQGGSGSGNGDSDLNAVAIGPYVKSIDDIFCDTDYYGNPVIRIEYTVETAYVTGPNLTVIFDPPRS